MNTHLKLLNSLCLYQGVFQNAIGLALGDLLLSLDGLTYGRFFSALAARGQSWQDYLVSEILWADNPFTRRVQQKSLSDLPTSLIAAVKHDLTILKTFYDWEGVRLYDFGWQVGNELESFLHQHRDWSNCLEDLAEHYRKQGVGIFGCYRALQWQNKQLIGIPHPDRIKLGELVGYEAQKQVLQQNTAALLAGYPALNVLLYGSRGTGKSSLVKALVNEYFGQGLRLLEVSKGNLQDLPLILEILRDVAQKFIIFVDDLSFEEDDDGFKALKVILEGSVTAKAENVVVYATSNRRHLIREFFSDRPLPREADEVHNWDTVQEKLSFSDRFGLTLTFAPANQDTYLEIVEHLAQQAGLSMDSEELDFRAKQWATQHNGRSGRTARQFIDFLLGENSYSVS